MPWTINDVDKHKTGLSDRQKKQWVRIANAALKACLKKGGTDETCAPKAIIQANTVINTNSDKYAVYKNKQESDYEVLLTVHQEKPHYVVPVVMMVEGVHNGSRGPVYHTINELGKIPEAWNGIPVVIDHPEDEEGGSISANSPTVIDNRSVGKVYNTKVEGTRLVAEVWLDEDKLNNISPDILEDITNNKLVEVSVGVFSDEEIVEGDWNGEHYTSIAHNYRPDHLAILTECVGACSCADGCGLRVNTERQLGHNDIEDKQNDNVGSGMSDDNQSANSSINNKMEVNMANECAPCIKAKVDALITNSKGRWVEGDREFLQTLTEAQLDKMGPIEVEKVVEKVVEKEIQVNVLSAEDQAALATYKRLLKEQKDKMILAIQTNSSKELWPDAVLNEMDSDMLKRIFDSVKREGEVDFSINGSIINNAGIDEIEPLLPVGVTGETKK